MGNGGIPEPLRATERRDTASVGRDDLTPAEWRDRALRAEAEWDRWEQAYLEVIGIGRVAQDDLRDTRDLLRELAVTWTGVETEGRVLTPATSEAIPMDIPTKIAFVLHQAAVNNAKKFLAAPQGGG